MISLLNKKGGIILLRKGTVFLVILLIFGFISLGKFPHLTELNNQQNQIYFLTTETISLNYHSEWDDSSSECNDVVVQNDLAFITYWEHGLKIINISNPFTPTKVGEYNGGGNFWSVTVDGNYAYLCNDIYGLQILDISNPSNPKLVSTYSSSNVCSVYIIDNVAYVLAGSHFVILNIANKHSPAVLDDYWHSSHSNRDVIVRNNIAYLAAGLENLEILNVTGNTIVPIAGYDDNPEGSTDANSFGIAILDDCVFIADWQDGLEIFEVSNKSNPMEISQLKYGHHATSVCINDSYAFLSDGGFLLEVIYIADPANPLSLGGLYTSGHGNAVVVQNDLILIAEYNSGLQIYSVILSPPSQTPTPPPLIPTTSPTPSVTFGFEFLILPFLFLFSFIILYFKKKCET